MKYLFKSIPFGICVALMPYFTACSDDSDENPKEETKSVIVGFQNVPQSIIGGPSAYGANLYDGSVSKGYLAQLDDTTFAQFPINYGYNYNADFNLTWCYTYYNGGLAVSNWHDMTVNSYENQLSVYNSYSPSGENFIVAFGSSNVVNPANAKLSHYDGCGRVYITDKNGYGVSEPGKDTAVTGVAKKAYFKSVYINNTTFDYLTILNGNSYASALNKENKGWFKVQFIVFESNDPEEYPIGSVEAYLANFDPSLADGYMGIIDEWMQVDLSSLPKASVLVINFVGSDCGEYGLNTPTYCALDSFEISVE